MKKILFLSPLPPPNYGSAISSKMCLEILKSDNRFYIKNIKTNYSKELSDMGEISLKKLYGIIQVSMRIVQLINKIRPDIVYFMPATFSFGLMRDFFFLSIIKIFNHKKIILHIRSQFKKEDWNNSFKRFLIQGLLKCDKVILLGPELIENLNEKVARDKIYILPNAINKTLLDIELENSIRHRNNNQNLNILFLSTMWKFKGWYKLLETCNLLSNSGVKYICHFVGDWPSELESNTFYNYIENNNLSKNVIFHGQLLGYEKKNMLMEADILILPTEFDSCPRVILEAMEYGLPVISTRVGTIPSLVEHDKTGYILEKNTSLEIFECILRLIDINLRTVFGRNGRNRFLARFTFETYEKNFIKIINDD
jgi:glycosyltransferase involved in cell wall biosynthesis